MRGSQDPAVQRRRLRMILRGAREAANLTQKRAASELSWSISKLMRIESGATCVTVTDLRALLRLYAISDDRRIDELVEMARIARYRHWATYRKILTPEFIVYLGYESAAATIRTFQPIIVPGLLQTEAYAETILRLFAGHGDEALVQKRLQARLTRQRLLFRRDPAPEMTFVLDETVLRRRVGSKQLMAAQLDHLMSLAARPNVHMRVLGLDAGEHRGFLGPFMVLEFEDPADDDVLWTEGWTEMVVKEVSDSRAVHKTVFAEIEAIAEPESQFPEIAQAIKVDWLTSNARNAE
jgi:transcriptional regulator with XRE-family HTH domain